MTRRQTVPTRVSGEAAGSCLGRGHAASRCRGAEAHVLKRVSSRSWAVKLQDAGIKCVCHGNRWPETAGSDPAAPAGGAGRARNKAVAQVADRCHLRAKLPAVSSQL